MSFPAPTQPGTRPRLSAASVAVALLSALASAGCGSPSAGISGQRQGSPARAAKRPPRTPRVVARLESSRLPSGVSGEAVSARGGEILVLGGLNSLGVSTSQIVEISPALRARQAGALSEAKHDLAAVQLGGHTLVLGGGSASELNVVEALSTQNVGTRLAILPSARSDLSAVTIGASAYLLGGYDGNEPLAGVLRTTDGSRFTTIGHLPVPFRYAAVVALGTQIYAFGGELANGEDTDAIQQIDTRTGAARVIGRLPTAVSHASAVVLEGRIYVLGGRSHGVALRRIVAFDPASKVTRLAGRLPLAVTNAAAIESSSTGYLIGGIGSIEQTLDTVIAVHLATG